MEQNQNIDNISDQLKAEILTQIGMGESVADVAKVYSVTENQVYGWIMEARKRQLAQPKPVPIPVAIPTPLASTPVLQATSIDAQMDALTRDFAVKLKDILKRQILESIRGI